MNIVNVLAVTDMQNGKISLDEHKAHHKGSALLSRTKVERPLSLDYKQNQFGRIPDLVVDLGEESIANSGSGSTGSAFPLLSTCSANPELLQPPHLANRIILHLL